MLKTFIRWLAKVTGADITVTKTVTKIVTKTVTKYLPPEGGTVQGDIYVTGTLSVQGKVVATGDVVCKASTQAD